MATKAYWSRILFGELSGREFETKRALAQEVVDRLNTHLCDFPPGYTYIDAIDWGIENGWVRRLTGGRYSVNVEATQ